MSVIEEGYPPFQWSTFVGREEQFVLRMEDYKLLMDARRILLDALKNEKKLNEEFPDKPNTLVEKTEPMAQAMKEAVAVEGPVAKPCPKCGSPLTEARKKDGTPFMKCSTQKWSKEEGQTGCDYVDWGDKKTGNSPATKGQMAIIDEKRLNPAGTPLTFDVASGLISNWIKSNKK